MKITSEFISFINNLDKKSLRIFLRLPDSQGVVKPSYKICKKCKTKKILLEFYKGSGKYGYEAQCKNCRKEVSEETTKRYRKNNKEKLYLSKKKWIQNNLDRCKQSKRLYTFKKKREDINYKLASNLRSRISTAIKGNQKSGSAVRDLGCSIQEFKLYIENQFQSGMTWNNYGKNGWELDHVIPLSEFNLTNRMEFLEACNWLNIQPLWKLENIIKGGVRKKCLKFIQT